MLECLIGVVIFQVKEILQLRIKEEAASQLSVSVYDTERNEKAKLHRQELVNRLTHFTAVAVESSAMNTHATACCCIFCSCFFVCFVCVCVFFFQFIYRSVAIACRNLDGKCSHLYHPKKAPAGR